MEKKNKKVIGLIKNELGGKTRTEFAALRIKNYIYLTDDNDENEKSRGIKKCVIKQKIKFEDYKNCLQATQFENEMNYQEEYKLDVDSLRENHTELIKKQ